MPLSTEVSLGPDDIVSDGDPAPPSPKGGISPSPIFGPCLLWPNAGCIKVPLGMEVGISPGDFVLDGTQPPPQKD